MVGTTVIIDVGLSANCFLSILALFVCDFTAEGDSSKSFLLASVSTVGKKVEHQSLRLPCIV